MPAGGCPLRYSAARNAASSSPPLWGCTADSSSTPPGASSAPGRDRSPLLEIGAQYLFVLCSTSDTAVSSAFLRCSHTSPPALPSRSRPSGSPSTNSFISAKLNRSKFCMVMFIYPQHAPAAGSLAHRSLQAHLVLETNPHFRLIVDWKCTFAS